MTQVNMLKQMCIETQVNMLGEMCVDDTGPHVRADVY